MALLHTEISGLKFNEIYKDIKLYKFLNNNLTHYDFTYQEGVNIDHLTFNPFNKCSSGGLYICEESKCWMYWRYYGQKLAFIKIPDDARVYIETNKFKVDKIIITKILNFDEVPDKFWINLLRTDYVALYYVKEQTYEICKLAIQQNALALRYIKEQSEEICKLAVQQNGRALQFVNEQTEDICKLAVQQDGLALQLVKEQTEEICKLAVQQNGHALEYVKKQFKTEEIYKLAVQQDGRALEYVKEQTEEICKLAVQQNGYALEYVKKKTDELRKLASQNKTKFKPEREHNQW